MRISNLQPNKGDYEEYTHQVDLDELFGPLYDEYYTGRNQEVSTNSAAPNISNNKDTPSSSTIIVDDNEAPPIVSTSEELTSPITNDIADESIQEDTIDHDSNTVINLFCSPAAKEADSSSTNQEYARVSSAAPLN
ncbi:hypothetical protein Tco_0077866 [Tanacetum coccineum]